MFHPTPIRTLQGLMLASTIALAAGCQAGAPTTGVKPNVVPANTNGNHAINGPHKPSGTFVGPKLAPDDTVANTDATGEMGKPGKTLYAIYVIGSDLEDNTLQGKQPDEAATGQKSTAGAASDNFREMIRGYQALTDAEKQNIDVMIAFGGSRKQGWQGIKYVDIKQLIADADNDYFGDGTDYLYTQDNVDLANEKTFEDFLNRVQARRGDASKVFVELWDHGGSYGGIGPDRNTGNILSLADIKQAFDNTNFQGDILGFDACLMASVEVASFMKDHFSYMIGSEETEPGAGWEYEVNTKFLGQHPEATLPDIGKAWVDSYIDSPSRQAQRGKTLSVINLKNVDAINSNLETMAKDMGGDKLTAVYKPLLDAAGNVKTRYGSEGKGGDEVSVDLFDLATQIQASVPEGASGAGFLQAAIKKAVVYSRDDGSRPNSNGISIFSIQNLTALKQQDYNANNAQPKAWFDFVTSFAGVGSGDTSRPTIDAPVSLPDGSQQIQVADNTGVDQVDAIHGLDLGAGNAYHLNQAGPNRIQILEQDTEAPVPGKTDTYVQPKWDGSVLLLVEGDKKLPVPLTDEGADGDYHNYTSPVSWRGEDALLYLVLDKDRNVVDHWVVPQLKDKDGIELPEREEFQLSAGDTIAFYNTIYNVETDEETTELGDAITLSEDTPNFQRGKPEGKELEFTRGQDLAGNMQNSDPEAVE